MTNEELEGHLIPLLIPEVVWFQYCDIDPVSGQSVWSSAKYILNGIVVSYLVE